MVGNCLKGINPCESFNKYIKLKFTNYEKMSLLKFVQIIGEDLIPYYSKNSGNITHI
jgi:hypothetical protein